MNPAACARAKKAQRLAREARERPAENPQLPGTPEEAVAHAFSLYRQHTRPFRRVFAGIITRKEAERFVKSRIAKQQRAMRGR